MLLGGAPTALEESDALGHFPIGRTGDLARVLDHGFQVDVQDNVIEVAVGQILPGIVGSPSGGLNDGAHPELIEDLPHRFPVPRG